VLLHDRRIPGTRANIDHLAVTPTGVYVIDTKKYQGRPSFKAEPGILRRVEKLLVGSHGSRLDPRHCRGGDHSQRVATSCDSAREGVLVRKQPVASRPPHSLANNVDMTAGLGVLMR
jgi:hypothetical protein